MKIKDAIENGKQVTERGIKKFRIKSHEENYIFMVTDTEEFFILEDTTRSVEESWINARNTGFFRILDCSDNEFTGKDVIINVDQVVALVKVDGTTF